MKNRHFFGLTVEPAFAFMVAALIANSPALAVEAPRQKLAASMTVFDAGSPREAEIKLRPDPKMTVFTPDGQREVAAEPAWPVQLTRAGWLAISTGYRHDNLHSSFAHPVSFRHEDNGTGWEAEISTDFRLTGAHRLTLDLGKREMKTSQGNDTTFFYNGSSSTIDLGETVLSNWSARLGYRYDY